MMTSVALASASSVAVGAGIPRLAPDTVNWDRCRFVTRKAFLLKRIGPIYHKAKLLASCCSETMPRASSSSSVTSADYERAKEVWIWTENKQVMTAAVERGWNTFLFSSQNQGLAEEWSSLALINPLFVEEGGILNVEKARVAMVRTVISPEDVQKLQPENEQAQIVVIDFADWQVIPAENIVATFQGSQKTVFAISRNLFEAQIFLEALEHGLGGVVLKVEDVNSVLDLKVICFDRHHLIFINASDLDLECQAYFDRRDEVKSMLSLEKAVITGVYTAGMGDRVCVDLCCLMKPGEGLLVGSFARGLFLVHSECMESDYISSRPFRVNAGPVHAYVAVPGGRTCYLSELKAGKEVIVVDQRGRQRTAVVERVKIESRPLILVEAKINLDSEIHYTILLQNAETVALVSPHTGDGLKNPAAIPVTTLKAGHEVVMRTQGGGRHTGIEIQEFIVER